MQRPRNNEWKSKRLQKNLLDRNKAIKLTNSAIDIFCMDPFAQQENQIHSISIKEKAEFQKPEI